MKLLFILSEYLPDSGGGIISYYAGILPHLVRAGHQVDVLVAKLEPHDRPERIIDGVRVRYLQPSRVRQAARGFDHYRAGFPTISAFLPVAWAAWEQARHGEGFDLVEVTDLGLLFAPWMAMRDAPPLNISMHASCGQLDWYDNPLAPTVDTDLVRLMERAAFTSAHAVQTNSRLNAEFWEEMTRRVEIPVLLPSFSVETTTLQAKSRSKGDGLVMGRFQIWKGPHVLCEALEKVPHARIRWIGRDLGDKKGRLMSETLRERYPHLFGTRLLHQNPVSHEEGQREIAGASFLCVPSLWDVFNLTAVEAMSLGTPVICSRRAGASMLIRHGENGFLFDPQNPAELAELIRCVAGLSGVERSRLTGEARATVAHMMNPENLCRERVEYYRTVISSPPRARDEWLSAAVSPRETTSQRRKILEAFTTVELLAAAKRQAKVGLKRRLAGRQAMI